MATRPSLNVALMLESDGPGGAEVVLLRLAEELRSRGHTVHPIGPERGQGWLGERLRENGFATHTFLLRSAFDWRCVRSLVALLRKLEVDVLHGHEFDGTVYGTAAARIAGRPSIVTLHANQSMTAAWRRRAALRWAFRRCAAVVAVSGETKRQLDRDLALNPHRISVIHNGMPVPEGDPGPIRRELGLVEGETLILAVGSLVERKGHIFLLRALTQLERNGLRIPWRLAIAGGGGGPEHAPLLAFAAEHGFADRVHILTYRTDIANLQAAADLFVMPSLWEGFPLAILEAMLAGTPVIASDVCGIPEAITHEQHGLLVPPGDVDALALAISRVLTSPPLREKLARCARERALSEFTVSTMTDAYEHLYRDAVDKTASRRAVSPR